NVLVMAVGTLVRRQEDARPPNGLIPAVNQWGGMTSDTTATIAINEAHAGYLARAAKRGQIGLLLRSSDANGVANDLDTVSHAEFSPPLVGLGGSSGLFCQRPAVLNPDRIFHDLVQYAPGMQTGRADVRAVVEAELGSSAKAGHVDTQARQILERARNTGWRK